VNDLERNKTAMRRVFVEAMGQGRLDVVDECLAPDAVDRHPFGPDEPDMRAHLKGAITMLRGAMPDLAVTVEDLVAEGNQVAARVTLRGTHTGTPLFGRAAQGRALQVEQFHLGSFNDAGQGVTHQANIGQYEFLAQLA
jgi:predicted ester cyclase